jgi:hypothetical protein
MRRYLSGLLAAAILIFTASFPVVAQATTSKSTSKTAVSSPASTGATTTSNMSQAVIQSYNSGGGVQLGMIVDLNGAAPGSVQPLTASNLKNMLGVRVSENDAAITLSSNKSTSGQQVYVATSGQYDVLVSNQNGPIGVGSYVTISALSGVGMLADENENVVLGKSDGVFNGTSNVQGTATLTNSAGKSFKVALGMVPVDLDISPNPLETKATDYVPSFLSKAAVTLSNKPVSAARIYLSLVVLAVSAAVAANVVYSGVRSGMQAIGRNPLSKKSIIRSLIQTVIAGLIVFIVGVFAVYLLLKL